jgi:hypothetical protein
MKIVLLNDPGPHTFLKVRWTPHQSYRPVSPPSQRTRYRLAYKTAGAGHQYGLTHRGKKIAGVEDNRAKPAQALSGQSLGESWEVR